jgi:hypothetical protein
MVPARHHIGIEADDADAKIPANTLELCQKCLPALNAAPGGSHIRGWSMVIHVLTQTGRGLIAP